MMFFSRSAMKNRFRQAPLSWGLWPFLCTHGPSAYIHISMKVVSAPLKKKKKSPEQAVTPDVVINTVCRRKKNRKFTVFIRKMLKGYCLGCLNLGTSNFCLLGQGNTMCVYCLKNLYQNKLWNMQRVALKTARKIKAPAKNEWLRVLKVNGRTPSLGFIHAGNHLFLEFEVKKDIAVDFGDEFNGSLITRELFLKIFVFYKYIKIIFFIHIKLFF